LQWLYNGNGGFYNNLSSGNGGGGDDDEGVNSIVHPCILCSIKDLVCLVM